MLSQHLPDEQRVTTRARPRSTRRTGSSGGSNVRRLEAEAIRDALLAVGGTLDATMGGSLLTRQEPRLLLRPHLARTTRRTTRPAARSTCRSSGTTCTTCSSCSTTPTPSVPNGDRATTTVAPQALFMMNSDLVLDGRPATWPTDLLDDARPGRRRPGPAGSIERAYGRPPTARGVAAAPRRSSDRFEATSRTEDGRDAGRPPRRPGRRSARRSWRPTNSSTSGRLDERPRHEPRPTERTDLPSPDAPRDCASGFGCAGLGRPCWPRRRGRRRRSTSDPLAPRPPHFPARAKRVIFLFMKGGPSHVDTFDHKPLLQRDDGKPLAVRQAPRPVRPDRQPARLALEVPPHGESGIAVSELFPHVAQCVDDLCIINSLHGTNAGPRRRPAEAAHRQRQRSSGRAWAPGSPTAWAPRTRTCPASSPSARPWPTAACNNWGSAFLPAAYQGTPLGNASIPADQARVRYIENAAVSPDVQRLQLDLLAELNRDHLDADRPRPGARRPDRLVRAGLPDADRRCPRSRTSPASPPRPCELYGLDDPVTADFGRQCLLARRFAERGVRFVQVTHSDTAVQWDQHSDLKKGHEKNAREVDRPIAGLLTDLKARGLLDDTLVLWGGEFGRTPTAQGNGRPRPQPRGLHHVAGRRRRQGRASATAPPTTTATTPSRTRSTSTTCTPRSCTCSGSTTSD